MPAALLAAANPAREAARLAAVPSDIMRVEKNLSSHALRRMLAETEDGVSCIPPLTPPPAVLRLCNPMLPPPPPPPPPPPTPVINGGGGNDFCFGCGGNVGADTAGALPVDAEDPSFRPPPSEAFPEDAAAAAAAAPALNARAICAPND